MNGQKKHKKRVILIYYMRGKLRWSLPAETCRTGDYIVRSVCTFYGKNFVCLI